MPASRAKAQVGTSARIAVWSVCCFLLAAAFALVLGRMGALDVALSFAWVFVLPVWLLFLPFTFRLKGVEPPGLWTVLGTGLLIGPGIVAFRFFMTVDEDGWRGDPLTPPTWIIAVLIAALLTFFLSAAYSASIRFMSR